MISAKALSDALTVLGAFTEAPTDTQLAAAELAEGSAALVARLSNALYGCALAHVMTAEVAAHDAGMGGQCRADAWQATGATVDNITLLLHYTAMRLSADLRVISKHLPAHPQVTNSCGRCRGSADPAAGGMHRAQPRRSRRRCGNNQPHPRC